MLSADESWLGISAANWGIIGAIATLVTVLAIPATVWATFQAGKSRRAALRWAVSFAEPLINHRTAADIEVRYRGMNATNPHLTTIKFFMDSGRDIPTRDFDKDRPVTLDLGAKILGITAETWFGATPPQFQDRDTHLILLPDLLPANSRASVTLVLDGPPNVTLVGASIENVDVEQRLEASRGMLRELWFFLWPNMLPVALLLVPTYLGKILGQRLLGDRWTGWIVMTPMAVTILTAIPLAALFRQRRLRRTWWN